MGFDLEDLFEELERIFATDAKASKKVGRLRHAVDSHKKYAIQCGILPRKQHPRK